MFLVNSRFAFKFCHHVMQVSATTIETPIPSCLSTIKIHSDRTSSPLETTASAIGPVFSAVMKSVADGRWWIVVVDRTTRKSDNECLHQREHRLIAPTNYAGSNSGNLRSSKRSWVFCRFVGISVQGAFAASVVVVVVLPEKRRKKLSQKRLVTKSRAAQIS
jgi:hypothetical protein